MPEILLYALVAVFPEITGIYIALLMTHRISYHENNA